MKNIKEYTEEQKIKIKSYIDTLEKKPKLVIINVGNDPASHIYIKGKLKDCAECNILAEVIHYDADVYCNVLYDKIKELNEAEDVTGFIVQLPLPDNFDENKIIEMINPEKDVDGFSKLHITEPATPQGIVDYLEAQNFNFSGKNAVILGRSHIVGAPLHDMLLKQNMNVINLHSYTSEEDKRFYIAHADLILSATGCRNTIDLTYEVKPSAVIIDFGMEKNSEGKICGDIEQDLPVAFQSHNPGSTGLTTRLALLTNLIKLYKIQEDIC